MTGALENPTATAEPASPLAAFAVAADSAAGSDPKAAAGPEAAAARTAEARGVIGTGLSFAGDATAATAADSEPSATAARRGAPSGGGGSGIADLLQRLTASAPLAMPAQGPGDSKSDPLAPTAPPADLPSTDVSAVPGAASAAGAAPAQPNPASPAQPAPAASLQLNAPLGSSAWSNELGARLTWMAGQGIASASLQLTPEHLGPLEVKISVRDGAARVWFDALHPDTRIALEQALPRLRELFAMQGLTLTEAGVSHESPGGSPRHERAAPVVPADAAHEAAADSATSRGPARVGLIDTYA